MWLEKFIKREDEPSEYGCKAPIDGGVYVLDPEQPSCCYGNSKPLSYAVIPELLEK